MLTVLNAEFHPASLACGGLIGMLVVMVIDCAVGALARRRAAAERAARPPARRRYFTPLYVAPDQAEAFCRDNDYVYTAAGAYKLVVTDNRPDDPDLAALGRDLARAQAKRPGMACLFRVSPLFE